MNITAHIGTHPQSIRYYLMLIVSTFRTMLAIGMLVLGSGLVGLATAVLLDGFDLVDVGLGLSIGEVLGSFIVIGVVGAFAFGIATEGRYGAAATSRTYPTIEVGIGRLIAGLVVAWLISWGARQVAPIVIDQNLPIRAAGEMVRATGAAGVLAAILGPVFVWVVKRGLERVGFDFEIELPLLYIVWGLLALATFSMPAA